MCEREREGEVARAVGEHEHFGTDTETYFIVHVCAGAALAHLPRVIRRDKTKLFRVSKFSAVCRYSETPAMSYLEYVRCHASSASGFRVRERERERRGGGRE